MPIHPTAIVDPTAEIHEEAEVGPFSIIGPNTVIGRGTRIGAYVTIERWTIIGERNQIANYACLGASSQDLKWKGQKSYARIGDDNIIREYASINRSSREEESTVIGNENCLLAYCHIAHDCKLGDKVIVSNYVGLAGNVLIEDGAVLGGLAGIHQFCRIGRHSIVGGLTKVTQDILPFCIADGHPARIFGANIIGLRRNGFPEEEIRSIKQAIRLLYRSHLPFSVALEAMEHELNGSESVRAMLRFCRDSQRGLIHPPRHRV